MRYSSLEGFEPLIDQSDRADMPDLLVHSVMSTIELFVL
jgi:hypothetical protein